MNTRSFSMCVIVCSYNAPTRLLICVAPKTVLISSKCNPSISSETRYTAQVLRMPSISRGLQEPQVRVQSFFFFFNSIKVSAIIKFAVAVADCNIFTNNVIPYYIFWKLMNSFAFISRWFDILLLQLLSSHDGPSLHYDQSACAWEGSFLIDRDFIDACVSSTVNFECNIKPIVYIYKHEINVKC